MFLKTYLKHTYKYKLSFKFLSALHAAFSFYVLFNIQRPVDCRQRLILLT